MNNLPAGDVHVWFASVDRNQAEVEHLAGLLDRLEVDRAARFRGDVTRRRFMVKHGIRRLILAKYLGRPPGDIAFESTAAGKPVVAGRGRGRPHFNESASDALAVYVVAQDMEVGIDIEKIRLVPDADQIVERYGSPAEIVDYRRLPGRNREVAFLRWWSAKEAFVKTIGSGMDQALDGFSVSMLDELRLLEVAGNRDIAARYSLVELRPVPGYVGALVLEGRPARILTFHWNPGDRMDSQGAA